MSLLFPEDPGRAERIRRLHCLTEEEILWWCSEALNARSGKWAYMSDEELEVELSEWLRQRRRENNECLPRMRQEAPQGLREP